MDYGKAIFGGICSAVMLISVMSCGHTMVASVDSRGDWAGSIAHDATYNMTPPQPHITLKKNYDIFVYQGE